MTADRRGRAEKGERETEALANEKLELGVGEGDFGSDEHKIKKSLGARYSAVAYACPRNLGGGERWFEGMDETIFEYFS